MCCACPSCAAGPTPTDTHNPNNPEWMDSVTQHCGFTADPDRAVSFVEGLTAQKCAQEPFDVSTLLPLVDDLADSAAAAAAGPRLVRWLLVFGRSAHVPVMPDADERAAYRPLLEDTFFRTDVMFVHDKARKTGATDGVGGGRVSGAVPRPQEVYDALVDLEKSDAETEGSLVLETHSSAGLYKSVAMLLAHPFQRAPQDSLRPTPVSTLVAAAAAGAGSGSGDGAATKGASAKDRKNAKGS